MLRDMGVDEHRILEIVCSLVCDPELTAIVIVGCAEVEVRQMDIVFVRRSQRILGNRSGVEIR